MGRFTRIPQNTFQDLQLDVGIIVKNFDPEHPTITDADIITATSGGVNIVCQPTFSNFGDDIDNVKGEYKELKHLDGWLCTLGFNALNHSPESIRLALGCADANSNVITPRIDLKQSDFEDAIWWIGDKADGGFVAVKLLNALSTGGLSIQTTKNNKGQTAVTLTGHMTINNQNLVPMEFYSYDGTNTDDYSYIEITPAGTENPANSGWYVEIEGSSPAAYRPTTDTTVDSEETYYIRTVAAQD